MRLAEKDLAMINGALGPGSQMAMELLVAAAPATGVSTLLDIVGAHIDGCLYHGRAGLDFALGRDVFAEASLDRLIVPVSEFGATFVTDTCTYITPILEEMAGVVMTNSGKWAYYAPGNLGVEVVLGSLADCVESAVAGKVVVGDRW